MKPRNVYRGTTLVGTSKPAPLREHQQVTTEQASTICPSCGTAGATHTMPGSGWMELVLWVAFLPAGAVYSVWRRSKRSSGCAVCGAKTLPIATPKGQQLARTHYPDGVPDVEVPVPVPPSKLVIFGLVAIVAWLLFAMSGAMR